MPMHDGDGFGKTCNVVAWILTALSIISVILRLLARSVKRDFGFDIVAILLASLMSKAVSVGMGAHIQNLTKEQGMNVTKWVVVANAVAVHGMSLRRRLAYSSIMSLGLIAFAFTIYKCTKLPALDNPSDPAYLSAQLLLWTCIESNVVILAACIPTLSPLVRVVHDRVKRSMSGSRSASLAWNPLKHSSGTKQAKHIRLSDDKERMNPSAGDVELSGYSAAMKNGTHVRGAEHSRQNSTFARHVHGRQDLESGPPSSDDLDLREVLVSPASEQSHAWAGKPSSSRGNNPGTQMQQTSPRDDYGIARNVEVTVTQDRKSPLGMRK
ncbi:MAG: hypothetical protein Q9159_000865 [Coniocarpon cinnabarinum]